MVSSEELSTCSQATQEAYSYFQRYFLAKLIKENHRSLVQGLQFNRTDPTVSNYILTISTAQVNIYDNSNMGNNLDLLSQYASHELVSQVEERKEKENELELKKLNSFFLNTYYTLFIHYRSLLVVVGLKLIKMLGLLLEIILGKLDSLV